MLIIHRARALIPDADEAIPELMGKAVRSVYFKIHLLGENGKRARYALKTIEFGYESRGVSSPFRKTLTAPIPARYLSLMITTEELKG